jgi:hypothetical protein
MVLLFGLLDLFLFVSTAKSDPDSWGLITSNIYQPPRNFHKNFQKCDETAAGPFLGWKKRADG